MPTDQETKALADAMWQLLDDMGLQSQCVCLAAKAQARVAYEPFREEPPYDDWISVESAKLILAEADR